MQFFTDYLHYLHWDNTYSELLIA